MAGACFALALRFAGSWNNAAFETIELLINKFIAVTKRSIADLTGKAVVEQTLCILVLAQGIVMAGSGDLNTLRTCRMLRSADEMELSYRPRNSYCDNCEDCFHGQPPVCAGPGYTTARW